MRRLLTITVVGLVLTVPTAIPGPDALHPSYRVSDYFASPGLYGTSYGFASYGMPRTYTTFSAYPGSLLRREPPALRISARPLRCRPLASRIHRSRLCLRRSRHRLLLSHLPGRLRHRPDRQSDRAATVDRRLCTAHLGPASVCTGARSPGAVRGASGRLSGSWQGPARHPCNRSPRASGREAVYRSPGAS